MFALLSRKKEIAPFAFRPPENKIYVCTCTYIHTHIYNCVCPQVLFHFLDFIINTWLYGKPLNYFNCGISFPLYNEELKLSLLYLFRDLLRTKRILLIYICCTEFPWHLSHNQIEMFYVILIGFFQEIESLINWIEVPMPT